MPDRRRILKSAFSLSLYLTLAWTLYLYIVRSFAAVYRLELGTFDFGIVEEAAYRFSRGDFLFLSTRGDHALADNQKYFQFLFGFLNWLHLPQPISLLFFHSFLGLLVALIVFLIFRKQNRQFALLMTILVLLHPMLLNMIFDYIHSEILTPSFLLLGYLAWKARRKWAFALLMLAACLIKEDVTFSVFALAVCYGISDFIYDRESFHSWKKLYLLIMSCSFLIFIFDLFVILPIYKDWTCNFLGTPINKKIIGHEPANPWYSYLFESDHPFKEAIEHICSLPHLLYFFGACVMLWLWNWRSLFILAALPSLLLNMLSWADYQTSMEFHYDHAVIAVLIIGIAEASKKMSFRQNVWRALLILAALLTWPQLKPDSFKLGLWGDRKPKFEDALPTDRYKTLMWIQQNLPPDEDIAANFAYTSFLMPPARMIFEFPNPYTKHYFGIYFLCEDWKRTDWPQWIIIKQGDEITQEAIPYMNGMAKLTIEEFQIFSAPEKIARLKVTFEKDFPKAHERN